MNCACSRAMQEGRPATAETDTHPGGHNLEISYTGVPIKNKNGVVIGALEIVSDQTAIKNAAQIADKQARFQGAEVAKLIVALDKVAQGDLNAQHRSVRPTSTRKLSARTSPRSIAAWRQASLR